MRMNLSYHEKLQQAYNKAARKRTPEQVRNNVTTLEMLYYSQRKATFACDRYETFITTWTGQEWLKRHQSLNHQMQETS